MELASVRAVVHRRRLGPGAPPARAGGARARVAILDRPASPGAEVGVARRAPSHPRRRTRPTTWRRRWTPPARASAPSTSSSTVRIGHRHEDAARAAPPSRGVHACHQRDLIGTFNCHPLAAGHMAAERASADGERGVVSTRVGGAFDGQIGQAAYPPRRAASSGALPVARDVAEPGCARDDDAPGTSRRRCSARCPSRCAPRSPAGAFPCGSASPTSTRARLPHHHQRDADGENDPATAPSDAPRRRRPRAMERARRSTTAHPAGPAIPAASAS